MLSSREWDSQNWNPSLWTSEWSYHCSRPYRGTKPGLPPTASFIHSFIPHLIRTFQVARYRCGRSGPEVGTRGTRLRERKAGASGDLPR